MAISNERNPYFTGEKEDCKLYNFVNSLSKIDKMYAYFKSGAFFSSKYDDFVDKGNYSIKFIHKEWEKRGWASPFWIVTKGIYEQYGWSFSDERYILYTDMLKPSLYKEQTAKEMESEVMNKDYFAKSSLMAENIRLFGKVAVPKKDRMEEPIFYCYFENSKSVIEEYKKIVEKYSGEGGTIEFRVKDEMYKAVISHSRIELDKEIVYKPTIKITKLYGN